MTSSNPSSHSTACLRAHPPRVRALREAAAAVGLSFALGCVASTVQAQSVRCWGWNDYGQCNVPTDLGPVSKVAGGYGHTIALKTDGSVRCWGWNDYGQCNVPPDLGPVSMVAGGTTHTIALKTDGSVRCWGSNTNGRCDVPPDLGPVSMVAGGYGHTIALKTDGSVRCWGDNYSGQCNVPTDLGPVSMVAGGGDHTIALKTDGSVRCWGWNVVGQCDVPPDLGPVSKVAGGGYHTIALKTDGSVRCWGWNDYGQCNVPPDLGPVSMVAGGNTHTIALKTDGSVRCWGWNGYGQCAVPTDLGPVSMVAGGYRHTIAISGAASPFTLSLTTSASHVAPGDTLTVRVSCNAPSDMLTGEQLAVHFDAARLALADVVPVAGSPFTLEIAKQIDNTAGTLRYAAGIPGGGQGLSQAAGLVDLVFTVRAGASMCGDAVLATFEPVGGFGTRFSRPAASAVVPALSNLASMHLDTTAPVLAGLPSDVDVPTDAGSTYGAFVSLPTVTATDECDGAVAVIATGIPSNGIFPIGSTTVTWTAVDATGNTASASRTVTVQPYQLLDLTVCVDGSFTGNSTRQIRVAAGAASSVVSVPFTQTCGTVSGYHVPVSASLACVTAKDVAHSITDSAPATVAGVRYGASVSLKQGDSNDDDMIDIVDFGLWVDDFGGPRAADARSNFDANAVVNNGDFSFISVNFFHVGESCTGALAGAHPRDRVSVKQLRREGLGRLESADINRDGWVDAVDVQMFMQGRRSGGAPQRADIPRESGGVAW